MDFAAARGKSRADCIGGTGVIERRQYGGKRAAKDRLPPVVWAIGKAKIKGMSWLTIDPMLSTSLLHLYDTLPPPCTAVLKFLACLTPAGHRPPFVLVDAITRKLVRLSDEQDPVAAICEKLQELQLLCLSGPPGPGCECAFNNPALRDVVQVHGD